MMTAVRVSAPQLHDEAMLTSSQKQDDFLLRNREVQRRSRARRKDYIQDLEKRVWQFQRDGIQATAEVQAAARKVAQENSWLRSLLAKHGISAAEIKGHLDSSRAASYNINSEAVEVFAGNARQPSATMAQPSLRSLTPATMHGASSGGLLSPTSVGGSPDQESVLYSIDDSPRNDHAQPSDMRTETLDSRPSMEGLQAPITPCHAYEQKTAVKGADETSCEDAARIIASMRGHEDPEGVWPELGCSSVRKCMVKNMTIFQMVDENR
jgi:hypothetical protein